MARVAGIPRIDRPEPIASRHNARLRAFRDLTRRPADPAETALPRPVLLDGRRLLVDALGAGLSVTHAAFTTERLTRPDVAALAETLAAAGAEVLVVTPAVMRALSPVTTPSGIVAVALLGTVPLARLLAIEPALVVLAGDVQDPGNVGAIVRAAEAAGATGVVACGATADPFGWKALRGAMGSAFRVPIARAATADAVEAVQAAGTRVLAAVPRGGVAVTEASLTGPVAFLVGGEGGGLAPGILDRVDETVSIPMQAPVESLNVAVACALLLYEARRQRIPAGTRPAAGQDRHQTARRSIAR